MHCTPARPVRYATRWLVLACVCLLAACATSRQPAPVEDRRSPAGAPAAASPSTAPAATPAPGTTPAAPARADPNAKPGAEHAGKPGYYTIKPGDTLIRVGLECGQNWRGIMRWNNIDNPNVVQAGQVLRVVPPGTDARLAATTPVTAGRVAARPLAATPAP